MEEYASIVGSNNRRV